MTTHTGASSGIVELEPGRLYRLGGVIVRDERVSWSAPGAPGYEPANSYLLPASDMATLIDPGMALHGAAVGEQIVEIVGEHTPIQIFLTRMEPDTVTGLKHVMSRVPVERVYAGGNTNPFDFFDDLNSSSMVQANYGTTLERKKPGATLAVGPDRALEIVSTPLRILTTFWPYDRATGTLFTSDSFGYLPVGSESEQPVSTLMADSCNRDAIRDWLLAKFAWLDGARTGDVVDGLRTIARGREIQRIAPAHGCVLEGSEVAQSHMQVIIDLVREVGVR